MKQTVVDAQAHPIEAVTVYMFRAEVRRIITLALEEGRNDFAIVNLPSSIAPDTVHVAGLSAGQASIVDTTCVVPSQPQAAIRSNVERVARKVAELQAAKRELLRELSLINARSDVLLAYARSLSGENTEPTDFVNFLTQFNAAGEVTLHASTRIEAAVQDLDDRIKKITSTNSLDEDGDEPMDPELKTKASVVISAKEACTVKLSLTYVVNKASWNPAYKLHATTDTKTHAVASTAVLHYCASITQTTGEDWNDVRLTLSTRGSSGIQGTPSLQRSLIRAAGGFVFGNNHPGHKPQNFAAGVAASMHAPPAATSLFGGSSAATSSFGFGGFGQSFGSTFSASAAPQSAYTATGGLFGSQTTEPHVHQLDDGVDPESTVIVESDPELRALEHVGAAATEQALSCTYSIETNVTIHTGDTPHRVTMMTIPLGVKTDYVAVPKVTPLVYLLCKFTNTSTHQFLPGSLVTYLDDSYVDTVPIPFVSVRGTVIKSLGTDTALSISFNQTRRKADANYPTTFAHKKTTVVTDIITLRNSRSTAIPRVLVRHAVPVPDDSRFRVTIKEPEALGELALGKDLELRDRVRGRWMDNAQMGSDISGRLEWSIDDVPAHATEEIKMVYEVAAPEDVNWSQT